jgi:hypothetical protein
MEQFSKERGIPSFETITKMISVFSAFAALGNKVVQFRAFGRTNDKKQKEFPFCEQGRKG